jgi:hypothetical protein
LLFPRRDMTAAVSAAPPPAPRTATIATDLDISRDWWASRPLVLKGRFVGVESERFRRRSAEGD